MIGYDFDKTIYRGDCSTNFFFYMIFTRFYLLVFTPYFLIIFLLYGLKIIGKKKFKELMYFFTPWYKNIDKIVDKFWSKQIKKIFPYYKKQQREDDIIISAGLEFIVKRAMELLNIKNYMATKFDVKTGKIVGDIIRIYSIVKRQCHIVALFFCRENIIKLRNICCNVA